MRDYAASKLLGTHHRGCSSSLMRDCAASKLPRTHHRGCTSSVERREGRCRSACRRPHGDDRRNPGLVVVVCWWWSGGVLGVVVVWRWWWCDGVVVVWNLLGGVCTMPSRRRRSNNGTAFDSTNGSAGTTANRTDIGNGTVEGPALAGGIARTDDHIKGFHLPGMYVLPPREVHALLPCHILPIGRWLAASCTARSTCRRCDCHSSSRVGGNHDRHFVRFRKQRGSARTDVGHGVVSLLLALWRRWWALSLLLLLLRNVAVPTTGCICQFFFAAPTIGFICTRGLQL